MPISRRDLLSAAAIGPGLIIQSLRAQQRAGPAPHKRGPAIFLDYDQAELDAAYDQAVYAPNMAQIQKRNHANSILALRRTGTPQRLAYGESAVEELDFFVPKIPVAGRPVPVHIFIHGGAWRGGSAMDYAFIAEPFVTLGAAVAIPDFAWVQNAGGDLNVLAIQVQRAIAWVYKNAAMLAAADPNRIHLSAHSSGAHLAACALTIDWERKFGIPNPIKTALLISGIYDLKAPRLSSRREYVNFDDRTEEDLSPQRHVELITTPVTIAYASLDSPEFQRQSREFANALRLAGKPVELVIGEHYNHFEFPETLANPYGSLGRVALAQMQLGPR